MDYRFGGGGVEVEKWALVFCCENFSDSICCQVFAGERLTYQSNSCAVCGSRRWYCINNFCGYLLSRLSKKRVSQV